MTIRVLRNGVEVAAFEIDENTLYQKELLGMDKVKADFYASESLDIQVDDYIQFNNAKYYVKSAPEVEKIDKDTFHYLILFYGETYQLYDKMLMHEGVTKFSYAGTPLDFLMLIMDNIQQLDPNWAIGDCALVDNVKTLTFDQQSCRRTLTQVAEEFELEYYIDGYDVYLLEEIGETQPLTFRYGRGNGLYSLARKSLDQSFATVWYGYGGTKNVDVDYRNAIGRLTFDNNPVEQNKDLYGHKEGSVTFEDVYPNRTADVTATPDPLEVRDSTLDFDLNDHFITEGGAKILFKTGDLRGNEFVITGYDHTTKAIKFAANEEESGYLLPNDTVKADIGDKYTILGIVMPQSYIDAAEALLEQKTIAHAAKNSNPKVAYELEVNEKFVRKFGLSFAPGDKVRVLDNDLNVDEDLRVQSIEYPLVNVAQVTAVISEDVVYTVQDKLAKDIVENERAISSAQAASLYARQVANEIRNYAILEQFKRTKVGDRAVMSGAFMAGNPETGGNAGVNGTGTDNDSIRFFAGSDFDNKETAPFRVQDDGTVFATLLRVLTGSSVGGFSVTDTSIEGTYQDNMNVLINAIGAYMHLGSLTKYVDLNPNSTRMMEVISDQIALAALEQIGLHLEVSNTNGVKSYAINAEKGDIRLGDGVFDNMAITTQYLHKPSGDPDTDLYLTGYDGKTHFVIENDMNTTIILPDDPKDGLVISANWINNTTIWLQSDTDSVYNKDQVSTAGNRYALSGYGFRAVYHGGADLTGWHVISNHN